MSYQNWLNENRSSVSERDFRLLERAAKTLLGNIVAETPGERLPWHPYRGICPSPRNYKGVWNWDSAFHAVAVARWDVDLAREQIRIFLDTQTEQGAFVDVLWQNGEVVDAFGKPPVMPWACMIVDKAQPDDAFLETAYTSFIRYERFWRAHRGGDADGLFHYDTASTDPQKRKTEVNCESGWDNSPRWDDDSFALWPIDLNCYMVTLYRAMDYMAERLGKTGDRAQWQSREQALVERLEETLWDDAVGSYIDRNRFTMQASPVLSPASFMPLMIGTASQERAAKMAGLAASEAKFSPGMPTVAYDDPTYESHHYWRGPTWLNVAYFALWGLKDYGFTDIAAAQKETILNWCDQNKDHLWEYYDSRTGKGLGASDFGWTAAFVIEFVLSF